MTDHLCFNNTKKKKNKLVFYEQLNLYFLRNPLLHNTLHSTLLMIVLHYFTPFGSFLQTLMLNTLIHSFFFLKRKLCHGLSPPQRLLVKYQSPPTKYTSW
jgi:hypothetical protein